MDQFTTDKQDSLHSDNFSILEKKNSASENGKFSQKNRSIGHKMFQTDSILITRPCSAVGAVM